MRAISPELQALLSVVAAVLDPAGILLEANAGFMNRLGSGTGWRIGSNASGCFSLPRFHELASAQSAVNGDVFFGTMRFDNGSGGIIELRGRVWRSAFGLCVLAEPGGAAPVAAAESSEASPRKRAQGHLQVVNTAMTDKLTGTGNLECLVEAFATEFTRVKRTGSALSMMISGHDRFGEFAEKYGADGSDKVLARCGFLLRLLTRPTDIATRIGADEFAVLLPHTNLAQAVSAAERIRKVMEKDLIEPLREPVTMSFGVAEFQTGEELETFLGRARTALDKTRDTGSNKVIAST